MPLISQNGTKLLFIHIPKTGGTYIESTLKDHADITFCSPMIPSFMKITPQHLTIEDLKLLFGQACNDFITFSIVHNTKDKLESEYKFRTWHTKINLMIEVPYYRINELHYEI